MIFRTPRSPIHTLIAASYLGDIAGLLYIFHSLRLIAWLKEQHANVRFMSKPLPVAEITSPIELVRLDKDFAGTDQHNASTSQAKPKEITPAPSAHQNVEHISRSLPDISTCFDRPLVDRENRNDLSHFASTSEEGTPRLHPIRSGSSDLLPIVTSDADTLFSTNCLPHQTASISYSNIITAHHAIPTTANDIKLDSLYNRHTSQKDTTRPSYSSVSANRAVSDTSEPDLHTGNSTPKSFLQTRSKSGPSISRNMEARQGSTTADEVEQNAGSSDTPLQRAGGTNREVHDGRYAGSGTREDVEKRPGVTSNETEPAANARSRKSSHMMQLFKDTSPEQRKAQEKKGKAVVPQRTKDAGADARVVTTSAVGNQVSQLFIDQSTVDGLSKNEQKEILPQRLRDKLSEETTGYKGEEDQEQRQALTDISNESLKDDSRNLRPLHLPHRLLADIRGYQHGKEITDDADKKHDKKEEHVSSAIFYPHKAPSPDSLENAFGDGERSAQEDHYLTLARPGIRSPVAERDDPLPVSLEVGAVSSKASDSGISSASDSEYSLTDGETTPKATPSVHGAFLGSRARKGRRPHTVPVPAIELKPFKNQVGGHTILYKFHKKGVTKPLTNDENKFYELVELAHPELLEFMTGYV